jgi:hypothetical protein
MPFIPRTNNSQPQAQTSANNAAPKKFKESDGVAYHGEKDGRKYIKLVLKTGETYFLNPRLAEKKKDTDPDFSVSKATKRS